MRDYFRLRARLIPYLSRCQREAYDAGVVTVRPMYYTFPDPPLAYSDQVSLETM